MIEQAPLPRLSPRQQDIVHLAAKGLTNVGIGTRLRLTKNTVRTHVEILTRKLGVHAKREIVFACVHGGLVKPKEYVTEEHLRAIGLLSTAQLEVLHYLTEPNGNPSSKGIAKERVTSPHTTRSHFQDIHSVLGVNTNVMAGIVYLAWREEPIPPRNLLTGVPV
jgi:DNA-binding NarL/FixJ family response regulator